MRGMIKWNPFNTLLNSKDLNNILEKRNITNKPIIMEDRTIEINNIIIDSLNNLKKIKLYSFNKGILKNTIGFINKINPIEKYILINNKRIYFKDIIKIENI